MKNNLLLCVTLAAACAFHQGRAQSFVVNSLIVGSADPVPTLTSATLGPENNRLYLGFSEPVTIGSGGNGGWSVSLSGGASSLTYSTGSGTALLEYTLSRPPEYTETGTVSYTQPGNGVEDSVGSDLASISNYTLTNSIPSEPSTTTTSIPHDEFLDGFQDPSTGYETGNTWTESGTTANISKPFDSSALTAGKPTGANNRALQIVLPSDGTETYTTWTRSTNISRSASNLDWVFYFRFTNLSATFDNVIARMTNTTGTLVMSVNLVNTGGVYTMYASGSSNSTSVTVSPEQWIKVHVHMNTTAGSCYFEAGNEDAYVTTNTFTRPSQDYGRIILGAAIGLGAGETGTLYYDICAWNTP